MLKNTIILIILIMLSITACQQKEAEQTQQQEFFGAREVKVAPAEYGQISSYLEFSGRILADEAINLKPALGGRVLEMHVQEGNLVQEGDLLAKLDDTQLQQAQLQFDAAEKNYLRMQELYKTGAIDAAGFEEMETAFKLAKSGLDFIRRNTLLTAPITGVITKIYKKQNEHYDAMMDPFIIRMVSLRKVKATFQISDADINQLNMEQSVMITVNSSEQEFMGHISFISPEADAFSGTFQVDAIVNNRGNILRNNQFARIKVLTRTAQNAIYIPQKAVLNNDHVFIVQDGEAFKKMIETGIGNEYEIEIKSGLEKDDVVVVIGNVGLTSGDKVEVVK